jgi:exodeoxyribonuclease V gamma subunit
MPARTDFRLYHGNDLELLAGLLAAELATPMPGTALLAPDTVLIPQPAMRRWLQKHLAETHGIAANLRFLAPGEFVAEALAANLPGETAPAVGDAARLRWRLWRLLADARRMRAPVFAPLRPVLGGPDAAPAARALAAWQLAGEVAATFEKYQAWRRDWLRAWDRGAAADDWQAELWRLATHGLAHRARRLDAYLARFGDGDGDAGGTGDGARAPGGGGPGKNGKNGEAGDAVPRGLPARLFAFATQNVSPDVLRVIASAARSGPLHFYFLSPVRGWWGDLRTARERLRDAAEFDLDGADDPFADDRENPLLRANGAAGRDFVRTLFAYDVVHPDYEQAVYEGPDPVRRPGLLHQLQRALLARAPAPVAGDAPRPAFADTLGRDASLQVHSCHTRLREVQVLHDQVRALLEAEPALQPRDIAVLAPDIDQYAPFVQAVFGGEAQARHAIPFALSDASTLAMQPLADAFLQLLDLPASRFAVNEVLDLLGTPVIAARFGLDAADFDVLQPWLGAAGARWGLDADQRAQAGAPAEAAYTWAWALDRLLLGHASGSDAGIGDIAPLPLLEGGQLDTLDRLLQGLRRLAQWQKALAAPRAPADWGRALAQLVADFFPEHARDDRDRKAIDDLRALAAAFAEEAVAAQVDEAVPLAVVRAWYAAAFADADARQPFLTGGITFGRMVPMRLVPFKVICLLGMDDGAFPRHDPAGSLNRLAAALDTPRRRVGDRSVRDDDRGLFLQLFAAATQVFYLSYVGQDARTGESLPPSVVVSELLDAAKAAFADPEVARARLTVVHPLQPFSPAALGAPLATGEPDDGSDPRRFGYQGDWADAARQATQARRAPPPFAAPLAPPTLEPDDDWTAEQLLRTLAHPPRAFLAERLGLRVPATDERLPEVEPFDASDGLARHQLASRVFDLCMADAGLGVGGDGRDALARRLLAEGRIAPGAAGHAAMAEALDALAPAFDAWRGRGGAPRRLPYALDLGPYRLAGVLPRVHADGLRQFSASRGHGKTVLALGLDALVWHALGHDAPITRCVQDGGFETLPPIPAEAARARLRALLTLATQARLEPLPLMPKAALAYVAADDHATGARAAARAWTGEHGEGRDAWVRVALRGAAPFAGDDGVDGRFVMLARGLFDGLPGVPASLAEEPGDAALAGGDDA